MSAAHSPVDIPLQLIPSPTQAGEIPESHGSVRAEDVPSTAVSWIVGFCPARCLPGCHVAATWELLFEERRRIQCDIQEVEEGARMI